MIAKLNINDKEYEIEIKENWTLLYVIRDVLQLTGSKCGCSTGDCGACKVLINGEAKNSCTILARKAQNAKVTTIEGISHKDNLHPVQEAFIEMGAVQCGFCTPGMVISAVALLNKNKNPTQEEILEALDNNLCRCTGYTKIIDAIKLAGKRMGGGQ